VADSSSVELSSEDELPSSEDNVDEDEDDEDADADEELERDGGETDESSWVGVVDDLAR
jgi:hypothetical protein